MRKSRFYDYNDYDYDYNYGYGYGYGDYNKSKLKKNSYSDYYGRSKSSYNSWGFRSIYSENDDNLLTECPDGYLTPLQYNISNRIPYDVKRKLNHYIDYDLIKDFSHMFYQQIMYPLDINSIIDIFKNFDSDKSQKVYNFFIDQSIEMNFSATPIEKAVLLYSEMIDQAEDKLNQAKSDLQKFLEELKNLEESSDPEDQKKAEEIKNLIKSLQQQIQERQEALRNNDHMSAFGKDKIDFNFQKDKESALKLEAFFEDIWDENEVKSKERDSNDPYAEARGSNNLIKKWFNWLGYNNKLQAKLKMMKQIAKIKSFGEKMTVTKDIKKKEVSNSKVKELMRIKSFQQAVNLDLIQMKYPNFHAKLLTNSLLVNQPVEYIERKQKSIILIDNSGSMQEGFKVSWLLSFLIDRLIAVRNGDAELYISQFIHNPNGLNFFHIKDDHDIANFLKYGEIYLNGGNTDINGILEYVIKHLETVSPLPFRLSTNPNKTEKDYYPVDSEGNNKDKIEILIINDGQDHVNPKKYDYKINSLILGTKNENLKQVSILSGGKHVYVNYNGSVKEYE